MSNNIEIIMDIDTLEIFEVIDLEETKDREDTDIESFSEKVQERLKKDLDRVWLRSNHYYGPYHFMDQHAGRTYELRLKNKHGTCSVLNKSEIL